MIHSPKSSEARLVRNILFIIIGITFAIGSWRILTEKTSGNVQEAEKIFIEEKNLEK